jgi:Phage integrase, N-terminal SAM-like domain
MGALREKMIEEIRLRNFSPRTEQSYVSAMVGLAKYYRQSPDQLSQEQIRAYLLHLKERGLSPSSRNVAISGMKFFYHTSVWGGTKSSYSFRRENGAGNSPEVLSPKEVERLLLAATKQRDRCLLMTAYATGPKGKRAGQAQSQRHRQPPDDGAGGGTGQGAVGPLHYFVPTVARRAARVLESASLQIVAFSQC